MSLSPGVVGAKTQLIDGVQVDTISELTSGNGTQHQGRTSGTAIAAGMVGEKITFTTRVVDCTTPNGWYANSSPLATLTSGVWLLIPIMEFTGTSSVGVGAYISTNGSNGDSGIISVNNTMVIPGSYYNCIPMLISYYQVASSTSIYAKAYARTTGIANISIYGYAIRIG